MPEGAVYVGRTNAESIPPFANPFRVGGYFKLGRGVMTGGFSWLQSFTAEEGFTKIETAAQATEWFAEYRRRYPYSEARLAEIRGKNIMCWCALCDRHKDGKPLNVACADCAPCHADPLGRIANNFACEAVTGCNNS